jgi:hypothetical protein
MIAVILWISRAAIHAPKITPVGDRDAQIGDLPPEFVVKGHLHGRRESKKSLTCPRQQALLRLLKVIPSVRDMLLLCEPSSSDSPPKKAKARIR